MNQQVTMPVRLNESQVGLMMGLEKGGSWPPVAWLLIQQEAAGLSRADFAKSLNCEIADIEMLIDSVTGLDRDESEAKWGSGIIALRTADMMNASRIAKGWDHIEALAVDKLANELSKMAGNGKPETMLAIATAANKATRRSNGEGPSRTGGMNVSVSARVGGAAGESGADVEMKSGDLGSITLHLSPRIRQQISDPGRIIEATANRPEESKGVAGRNLEMLRLGETRSMMEKMDAAELAESKREQAQAAANELDAKPEVKVKFDLSSLMEK